jgi:hypothetical protein
VTRDGILDDDRARVIRFHDRFVVNGQGCKLDAVRGKETNNVVCSDVFAVTNILHLREDVLTRHQSLCYGEDRGKKSIPLTYFVLEVPGSALTTTILMPDLISSR